jgi:hypothetical protein
MNNRFIRRVLEKTIGEAILETNEIDYFKEIFRTDGIKNRNKDEISANLADFLKDLCHKQVVGEGRGAGHRFVNLVMRENDVSVWIKHIEHEQERKRSRWIMKVKDSWNHADLRQIPFRITRWHNSLSSDDPGDYVVRRIRDRLIDNFPEINKEYENLAKRAFRSMIWRIRT